MIYLSFEEIVELHNDAIEQFGGLSGVRDMNALKSAVDQPRMSQFGAESYPRVSDKAAALMFSLIKNHGFVDGNKRVGLFSALTFLNVNGYDLRMEFPDGQNLAESVARGETGRNALCEWIENRIIPIRP